jgi:hypothetical protein
MSFTTETVFDEQTFLNIFSVKDKNCENIANKMYSDFIYCLNNCQKSELLQFKSDFGELILLYENKKRTVEFLYKVKLDDEDKAMVISFLKEIVFKHFSPKYYQYTFGKDLIKGGCFFNITTIN